MAHCRGRSGPLDDVLRAAWGLGLHPSCNDLRDVEEFAGRLEREYRVSRDAAVRAVAAEIDPLAGALARREATVPAARASIEAECAASLARIADEVALLQVKVEAARAAARESVVAEITRLERSLAGDDPVDAGDRTRVESEALTTLDSARAALRQAEESLGFLRAVLAWVPRWVARRRIRRGEAWRARELRSIDGRQATRRQRLNSLQSDIEGEVERRADPKQSWLDGYRRSSIVAAETWQRRELARIDEERETMSRRLDDLRTNAGREAERRVAADRRRLDAVQAILKSKEMVGARAEVQVADELRRLSDEYHVLHHLRLEARHFLRCEGVRLQSAEVDHLVVGPTGIYLLETKCWGGRFVASGAYFDPFAQVRRAGLLCHVLLKDAGLPARVRELVVPFGDLPNPAQGSRARIVRPARLLRWIRGGRPDVDPAIVPRIAGFLWDNFGAPAARTA